MGMYSQRGAIDLKRLFGLAEFLKDHAKTRQSPEMPGVQRQRSGDLLDLEA
jgi:hypothetical protein